MESKRIGMHEKRKGREIMKEKTEKKQYTKPELVSRGKVKEVTLSPGYGIRDITSLLASPN